MRGRKKNLNGQLETSPDKPLSLKKATLCTTVLTVQYCTKYHRTG